MVKFVKENKLTSVIIGFLLVSLLSYGTWVTNSIFGQREKIYGHIIAQDKEEKAISKQVEEVKDELSKFKNEVKNDSLILRKDIVDNQKELLKLLIEIKKK